MHIGEYFRKIIMKVDHRMQESFFFLICKKRKGVTQNRKSALCNKIDKFYSRYNLEIKIGFEVVYSLLKCKLEKRRSSWLTNGLRKKSNQIVSNFKPKS